MLAARAATSKQSNDRGAVFDKDSCRIQSWEQHEIKTIRLCGHKRFLLKAFKSFKERRQFLCI